MHTGVPSDEVTVHLLGPVRVRRAGTEIVPGATRRAAVLTALAMHAGRPVSRDVLITAVWGDSPPASVVGNLHTYVSEIRRSLAVAVPHRPAGPLVTSAGGYCLRIQPSAVDARRFEILRMTARRHRTSGDRSAELTAVESALLLWRGDALDGVPGPFAESQRARLTELRVTTMKRQAVLLLETGRYDSAVLLLRELVGAFPLREDLRGVLDAALRGHRVTSTAVRRRSSPPAPGAPEAGRPGPAPLFGRSIELTRLHRAIAGLAEGRGGNLRLEGGSGIGKSALLTSALTAAVPAGCRIGRAVAGEFSPMVPLGVLQECLDSARPGIHPDDHLAAAERIRRLCTDRPLILAIDDLHWADADTRRLWTRLHPLTTKLPLLLIATAHTTIGSLRSPVPSTVLPIRPLRAADADVLIRSVTPQPLPPSVRHRIRAHAGGNPYHLHHLARYGPPPVAGTDPPPAGLTAAVDAHVAPLPEITRRVLRTIAAVGPRVMWDELVAMTAAQDSDLLRVVAPARAAGILVRRGRRLEFPHPVVHRVLHHGTPAAVRGLMRRWQAECRRSICRPGTKPPLPDAY